jgi:ATP-dependent 26S proteasome regulatory subunit
MLREELQLLQEPGSYVGEVVKVMGKSKVLVKVFSPFPRSHCDNFVGNMFSSV